jgi:hypothetical protein
MKTKSKPKTKARPKSKPRRVAAASGTDREFLRHTLATLAYRGGKAIRATPPNFGEFRAGETTRTPAQILAHIGDLLDWALTQASGKETWRNAKPQTWEQDVQRFHAALQAFDEFLASKKPLKHSAEKIFQGAIADALTHVGQISLLRRLAGAPVRGENYNRADIVAGRVGAAQSAPRMEFN